MSISRDLDDTANLRSDDGSSVTGHDRSEDTDRLAVWLTRATALPEAPRDQAHPYAEGIIRFYRARTIVDSERSERSWRRAWRYLDSLSPRDLPPAARRRFLELVYFMKEQGSGDAFAAHDFRLRVRLIAELIDNFVDELNDRFDA